MNTTKTIDSVYVEGVSITYGSPSQKHIWTYANGLNLMSTGPPPNNCPCNNDNSVLPPPFVGSDYYCETGDNNKTCCSHDIPSTPMTHCGMDSNVLVRRLPAVLTPACHGSTRHSVGPPHEDIELRVCGDNHNVINEDTPLEVIELFVR